MKRFLLLWLAGALLIALGVGSLNVPFLYRLAHKGVPTCGTITGYEPENHNSVHYTYEVNGKTYTGVQQGGASSSGSDFSPSCRDNVVYYLPENPQQSCIGYPEPMLRNELDAIAIGMLIFPALILLVWRWRYPGFRKWLTGIPSEKREKHSLSSI
jgi:Protein of unknown function (DUF3592)